LQTKIIYRSSILLTLQAASSKAPTIYREQGY